MLNVNPDVAAKLDAAQKLGLKIDQEYKLIDNKFSVILSIKKDDTLVDSFTMRADKQSLLETCKAQKTGLEAQIIEIDKRGGLADVPLGYSGQRQSFGQQCDGLSGRHMDRSRSLGLFNDELSFKPMGSCSDDL